MVTAIYPGSFDPITNGHYEVLMRASRLFEKIIVVILTNKDKNPFLSAETRMNLIKESIKDVKNIEIDCYEGLTVEYAGKKGAQILIRGLRAVSDFEYEMQMAQTNKNLNPNIDTIFLVPSLENNFVSSSIVKEIARFGGDISKLVPKPVQKYFKSIRK
ncbi:MAG: pantetheine-phosphate adenylyltransferase [Candidatus Melainabacteria bacterium GWF2_37_15]|nr:MAG: pantetheine-phosphate adenylyltransferase [Candidatus Melainabacteria bacterium GWF2_37_15]